MPPDPQTAHTYVVAGCKPWSQRVFKERICRLPGVWHYAGSREELTGERLFKVTPKRIFFLHWSWRVPPEILQAYECICFHMTDVPYGRGGSPLQNLIVRGHRETRLTALRMTEAFDAGPVYLKADLSLEGGAEEVYIRMAELAAEMIRKINAEDIQPAPQEGMATVFKRRTPEQSRIEDGKDLQALYDFIRMLDAEGYPRAFLTYGGFRLEFSRAVRYDGRIRADVEITPLEDGESE